MTFVCALFSLLFSLLNLILIQLLFMLKKEPNKDTEFVVRVSCCSNIIFRIRCILCLIFEFFPSDTLYKIYGMFILNYLKISFVRFLGLGNFEIVRSVKKGS